jgi:hypothetical protein
MSLTNTIEGIVGMDPAPDTHVKSVLEAFCRIDPDRSR